MTAPHGRILTVVSTPAPDEWPVGWDGACVMLADLRHPALSAASDLTTNADGWHNIARGRPVGVWVDCGPESGGMAGTLVEHFAPWAEYVVLQFTAVSGAGWEPADTVFIVDGCRASLPDMPVGFATYPTADDALEQGVNWRELKSACDFAVPLVAAPYMAPDLAQVWADHGQAYLQVAPEDDSGWLAKASESVHRSGAVFVWHGGMADARTWGEQIPAPARQEVPVAASDPLTPGPQVLERLTTPFVAWDGDGWWVTDLVRSRSLERGEVDRLVAWGLQVIWWPECGKVTVRE